MGNLDIWNTLGKTDPDQTKQFQRGGGFKGTAIKPIYTDQKMTEMFGPCGTGWGFSEPQFQLVPGSDGQVAVYCWLSVWYVQHGKRSEPVPGVGGDFVIVKQSSGLRTDDEAFKKAFTDAIGNAMKHLGMSADVHMGLFDDSKYVAQRRREEAEEGQQEQTEQVRQVVPSVEQVKAAKALVIEVGQCKSMNDLDALLRQPELVKIYHSLTTAQQGDIDAVVSSAKSKFDQAANVTMAG